MRDRAYDEVCSPWYVLALLGALALTLLACVHSGETFIENEHPDHVEAPQYPPCDPVRPLGVWCVWEF